MTVDMVEPETDTEKTDTEQEEKEEKEAREKEDEVDAVNFLRQEENGEEGAEGEFEGEAEFAISLRNILQTSFGVTVRGSRWAGREMLRLFTVLVGALATISGVIIVILFYILTRGKKH